MSSHILETLRIQFPETFDELRSNSMKIGKIREIKENSGIINFNQLLKIMSLTRGFADALIPFYLSKTIE